MSGDGPHRTDAVVAGELFGLAGTAAVVLWIPFLTRPGAWPAAVLVMVALLAGCSGVALDLLARLGRSQSDPASGGTPADAAVGSTTLIVLGDEPVELQHNTAVLAMAAGPCVVIEPRGRAVPEQIVDLGSPIVVAQGLSAGVAAALDHVTTGACLLVSGRAVPVIGPDEVAAMLDSRRWVTGSTEPIGVERGAPDVGYEVGAALRGRAASAGLVLWEPNATAVRTDALRGDPLPDRAPRGSWLRATPSAGDVGRHSSRVISAVAVPTSTSSFWAESVAQQSGFVADAAAAVRSERGRPRLAALLVLLRLLPVWAIPAWLAVLLTGALTESVPFDTAWGLFPLALIGVVTVRHVSLHRALGVAMQPRAQALAHVMRIPAVYASLRSAATARVYGSKPRVRPRLMLWIVVLAAVIAVAFVIDDDGVRLMSPAVAIAAVVTLALLWLAMIRVMALQHWERVSMRIPLNTAVLVGDEHARAVDGSPDGLALVMSDGQGGPAVGTASDLVIDLGSSVIAATGTVVHRRSESGRVVLGVRLLLEGEDRRRWAAALLGAARSGEGPAPSVDLADWVGEGPAVATESRFAGWSERLALAGAGVMSIVLLGALVAAMLGVHTSVVRSASMDPTIPQGSLVFSVPTQVDAVADGTVITRPGSDAELPVTHRLVSRYASGDEVVVTTKGDANSVSETWTVPASSSVQRIVWHVPLIGSVLAGARSGVGLVVVATVVLGLVVAALRPLLRRSTSDPAVA